MPGRIFVSFAVPTFMVRFGRPLSRQTVVGQVPRRLKELHLRLGAATGDLSQRLAAPPTATELAAELTWTAMR